ncbi:hypothetical protein ES703_119148 [subsurface metagenome]
MRYSYGIKIKVIIEAQPKGLSFISLLIIYAIGVIFFFTWSSVPPFPGLPVPPENSVVVLNKEIQILPAARKSVFLAAGHCVWLVPNNFVANQPSFFFIKMKILCYF